MAILAMHTGMKRCKNVESRAALVAALGQPTGLPLQRAYLIQEISTLLIPPCRSWQDARVQNGFRALTVSLSECYKKESPRWRYRLGVRTSDSQSENPGSIPGSATKSSS